jgi:predicted signal transduction protein with EAL and GGDEF domain
MFRTILRRYGIVSIAIGITISSILLSLGITWSVNVLMNGGPLRAGLAIAILAPLLITPLMTLHMLRLLTHLDRTEQQLRVLSYTDDLTQAYNRRYFVQYVSHECKRAQRSGESFAIAILDLYNFKQINDQCGHLVGDQMLQARTRGFEEQCDRLIFVRDMG